MILNTTLYLLSCKPYSIETTRITVIEAITASDDDGLSYLRCNMDGLYKFDSGIYNAVIDFQQKKDGSARLKCLSLEPVRIYKITEVDNVHELRSSLLTA